MQAAVSPAYTAHRSFAVCPIRGVSLLVLHRSRHLGAVDLHAADAEQRQDRDREHDDPHAAEPAQQVAPQIDGARQELEPERTVPPVVVRPEAASK